MPSTKKLKKLQKQVFSAARQLIKEIEKEYQNNEVYAFVFFTCTGFDAFCIVHSTKSSLSRIKEKAKTSLEEFKKANPDDCEDLENIEESFNHYDVDVCEWEFVRGYEKIFSQVSNAISEASCGLRNEGLEFDEVDGIFENLLTEVIIQLRDEKAFQSSAFEDDILLGIQFSDAEDDEVEMSRRVSEKVNSAYWHQRVCEGYDNY